MRERTFDTFRVRPKTAFYGFVFGVIVPAGMYSLITWHKVTKLVRWETTGVSLLVLMQRRQDRLDGKEERKFVF